MLVLVVAGAIVYLLSARYANVAADGLVQGDLIPVAPLFRARIERSFVQCGQAVRLGQPLVVVTNFLMQGEYQQNYQRAVEDLNTERVAESEGLQQAIIAQSAAAERYEAALYEARKAEIVKNAYQETFREGAIDRVAYDGAVADWKAAQSQAESLRQMRDEAQERIARVQEDNEQRVAGAANVAATIGGLEGQVQSQTLGSPAGGRVVACAAEPLAIVDAGTAIYKVFSPARAYVIGYFDPSAISAVRVGQTAYVSLTGWPEPVAGKVVMIYPTIERLPDELTRYFWQHEQWSKYQPVKISLAGSSPAVQSQLAYGAQVRVEIPRHALPWSFQRTGTSLF